MRPFKQTKGCVATLSMMASIVLALYPASVAIPGINVLPCYGRCYNHTRFPLQHRLIVRTCLQNVIIE